MTRRYRRFPTALPSFLVTALAFLAGPACTFDADFSGTRYRCDQSGTCPEGSFCVNGWCRDDSVEGGVCGTLAVAQHDFERAIDLDTLDNWSIWDYHANSASYIDTRDGVLRFELPNDLVEDGAEFMSRKLFARDGSQATVELLERSYDVGSSAYFLIIDDQGDHLEFYEEQGQVHLLLHNDNEETVLAQFEFDLEAHRFWRIRVDRGVGYFETSADGVAFVEHASTPTRDIDPWIGVMVGLWKWEPTQGSAVFVVDNLNTDQTPAPFCPTSFLQDDFDDQVRSTDWELDRNGSCLGYEQDGRLVFEFPSSGSAECRYRSASRYDLRNSTIEVEAPLRDTPGLEQCLKLDLPGFQDIEFELQDGMLRGERSLDSTGEPAFIAEFDPEAHAHWRFRAEGDTVHWEVSPDRQEWRSLGSHTDPDLDISQVRVQLIGDTDVGDLSNLGQGFDNLNVSPQ